MGMSFQGFPINQPIGPQQLGLLPFAQNAANFNSVSFSSHNWWNYLNPGFSLGEADWYWPRFPRWTPNGYIRPNLLGPAWLAKRGGQVDFRGAHWDRYWVTYYRPRLLDIDLAESLFPGQGKFPPWEQVYFELLSFGRGLNEIYRLNCCDALSLLSDLRRRKQAEQLYITAQAYWDAEQTKQAAVNILAELLAEKIRQSCFLLSPPAAQTIDDVNHVKTNTSTVDIQASTVTLNASMATLNASTVSVQAAQVAHSNPTAESALSKSEASEKAERKPPKWWWKKAEDLLKTDPGMSDHAIAKEIGISPSTLSRDREFQELADNIRRMSIGKIRQGIVNYDQEEYRHVDGVVETEEI
jgi:hypothetical protein